METNTKRYNEIVSLVEDLYNEIFQDFDYFADLNFSNDSDLDSLFDDVTKRLYIFQLETIKMYLNS